jgi:hypothetical protein
MRYSRLNLVACVGANGSQLLMPPNPGQSQQSTSSQAAHRNTAVYKLPQCQPTIKTPAQNNDLVIMLSFGRRYG